MFTRCCCCSLQTGGITLSVLGIIAGFITLLVGVGEDAYVHIVEGAVCTAIYVMLLGGSIKCSKTIVGAGLVFHGALIVAQFTIVVIALASIEIFFPQYANNCVTDPSCEKWHCWSCDSRKSGKTARVVSFYLIWAITNIVFWLCYYSFYQEISREGPDGGNKVSHPSNAPPVGASTAYPQQTQIVGNAGMVSTQVAYAQPIQQPGYAPAQYQTVISPIQHQTAYNQSQQQPVYAPSQLQPAYDTYHQQQPPAYAPAQQQVPYDPNQQQHANAPPALY